MNRDILSPQEEMRMGVVSKAETVEVRFKRLLTEHQVIVADLEKAIEMLEKQPKLLETLNLLRKVGI